MIARPLLVIATTLLLIATGLPVIGCQSIEVAARTGDGGAVPIRIRHGGKGCILVEHRPDGVVTVIGESDGVSVNFAGMLRWVTELAAALPIAGGVDRSGHVDTLEQGEGCRGVLEEIYTDEQLEGALVPNAGPDAREELSP